MRVREPLPSPAAVREGAGSVGAALVGTVLLSGGPLAGVLNDEGCWSSYFAFPIVEVPALRPSWQGSSTLALRGAGLSPGLRRVELLGSRGWNTVAVAVVVAPVSEVRQRRPAD